MDLSWLKVSGARSTPPHGARSLPLYRDSKILTVTILRSLSCSSHAILQGKSDLLFLMFSSFLTTQVGPSLGRCEESLTPFLFHPPCSTMESTHELQEQGEKKLEVPMRSVVKCQRTGKEKENFHMGKDNAKETPWRWSHALGWDEKKVDSETRRRTKWLRHQLHLSGSLGTGRAMGKSCIHSWAVLWGSKVCLWLHPAWVLGCLITSQLNPISKGKTCLQSTCYQNRA